MRNQSMIVLVSILAHGDALYDRTQPLHLAKIELLRSSAFNYSTIVICSHYMYMPAILSSFIILQRSRCHIVVHSMFILSRCNHMEVGIHTRALCLLKQCVRASARGTKIIRTAKKKQSDTGKQRRVRSIDIYTHECICARCTH